MRTHIIYICSGAKLLFCCLLGLLPQWVAGQTSAPYVAKKPGMEVQQILLNNGGMWRQDTDFLDKSRGWYFEMPNGLNDLMTMNFVDGYSLGLHCTIGRMSLDRSRWELEEDIRWTFGRKQFVAKGALRYILPVEYETFFEIYGGQFLEDFDPNPAMSQAQSLMASGICGWNHYKLYESTSAGVRFSLPLTFDLKMSAKVGWERRRQMENSQNRNLFGAHAQSNDPRVGVPHSAGELMFYDGPIDSKLGKASLRFDYKHQRSLLVIDDMTVRETLTYPTYSLLLDMGVGKNEEQFRFLTVDAQIRQTMQLPRHNDLLSYMFSTGYTFKKGTLGLADMHHFDASPFWWQRETQTTRFALLDNYELSTDRQWVEGHAEWNSRHLLLNRLVTPKDEWREFVQLHFVKVPDHRLHWESQYGWELLSSLRVGVSVGFDDATYRGTAITMTLDLKSVANKK